MATSGLGMLQQDAAFQVSSAASLNFDLLFLTFTCKLRASLALNKSKILIQKSFFSYPRYVVSDGFALHKSSALQIIFLPSHFLLLFLSFAQAMDSAGYLSSWQQFKDNLKCISMVSVLHRALVKG